MDAALDRFARQGYEATRIADIAARAGVSTAAIYVHFRSVRELAEALYREHFTAYARELAAIHDEEAPALDRLRRIVHATIARYRENVAAFTFVSLRLDSFLRQPPDGGVRYPLETVELIVRQGQRDGAVREGNAALLASLFIGALLRPMILAEFADAHSFTLTREHDAVIEAACIALLEAERAHDR